MAVPVLFAMASAMESFAAWPVGTLKRAGYSHSAVTRRCGLIVLLPWTLLPRVIPKTTIGQLATRLRSRRCSARPAPEEIEPWWPSMLPSRVVDRHASDAALRYAVKA